MALAMVLAWNTALGRRSFEVYEEGDKKEKEKGDKNKKERKVLTGPEFDDRPRKGSVKIV